MPECRCSDRRPRLPGEPTPILRNRAVGWPGAALGQLDFALESQAGLDDHGPVNGKQRQSGAAAPNGIVQVSNASNAVCNHACLQFVQAHLTATAVRGRRVLEVGARNVNGSARRLVESFQPSEYLGVDIAPGPGVDQICDIGGLVERFGAGRFDVVVCTEVLEHVRDWRGAVGNLKGVLATGGTLLATTRSIGFRYHGYPFDFWRYQPEDIAILFADMAIGGIESDPIAPGVFFTARKPHGFTEARLDGYRLHSVVRGRRCASVSSAQLALFLHVKRPVTRFFARQLRSIRKRINGSGAADAAGGR